MTGNDDSNSNNDPRSPGARGGRRADDRQGGGCGGSCGGGAPNDGYIVRPSPELILGRNMDGRLHCRIDGEFQAVGSFLEVERMPAGDKRERSPDDDGDRVRPAKVLRAGDGTAIPVTGYNEALPTKHNPGPRTSHGHRNSELLCLNRRVDEAVAASPFGQAMVLILSVREFEVAEDGDPLGDRHDTPGGRGPLPGDGAGSGHVDDDYNPFDDAFVRRLFFRKAVAGSGCRHRHPDKGQEIAAARTARVTRCGNCQREGHEVQYCIKAQADTGFVGGCAACNEKEHLTDQCARLDAYNDRTRAQELFHLYVVSRTGLPPLAAGTGYSWAAEAAFREEVCSGYPMTSDETRDVVRASPDIWETWDYSDQDSRVILGKEERRLKDKAAVISYAQNNAYHRPEYERRLRRRHFSQ